MKPSAGPKKGEKFVTPISPGRLRHLEAEIAAMDRRLLLFQGNVSRERLRQAERRDRKMSNVGLTPDNAFDPAWDWISPARFSRKPHTFEGKRNAE